MRPHCRSSVTTMRSMFGGACEFIAALAEAGVETTVTAVATADTAAVRDLGTALGAVAFKERTFLE